MKSVIDTWKSLLEVTVGAPKYLGESIWGVTEQTVYFKLRKSQELTIAWGWKVTEKAAQVLTVP